MNVRNNLAGNLLSLITLLLLVTCSTTTLSAQEARGTITGKITETTQAVVPGASVKVTNVAMGTTVTVETNDAGIYQAPYLIPGTYRITVEVKGFKKYIRDGILLWVNDNIEIDVALELGDVGESVTVTADAPVLETTSGSMG